MWWGGERHTELFLMVTSLWGDHTWHETGSCVGGPAPPPRPFRANIEKDFYLTSTKCNVLPDVSQLFFTERLLALQTQRWFLTCDRTDKSTRSRDVVWLNPSRCLQPGVHLPYINVPTHILPNSLKGLSPNKKKYLTKLLSLEYLMVYLKPRHSIR